MSSFAVAAFHEPALAAGAASVEAVVWIRAADLGPEGVDVALSVWTPAGAEVTGLREVAPAGTERLADAVRVDDHTLHVGAGRWLDGVHELELEVALPDREPGDEMLAARVAVLADGERVAGALIAVTWTEAAPHDDPAASPTVAEVDPACTAPVTRAELPTGASPEPRHTGGDGGGAAGRGAPCPGCGELPDDGDRFCEACGGELAAG